MWPRCATNVRTGVFQEANMPVTKRNAVDSSQGNGVKQYVERNRTYSSSQNLFNSRKQCSGVEQNENHQDDARKELDGLVMVELRLFSRIAAKLDKIDHLELWDLISELILFLEIFSYRFVGVELRQQNRLTRIFLDTDACYAA